MEEVQDQPSRPVTKLAARRPDWELPELHSGLELAPLDVLRENKERITCPKCGRSRAHYCYDCLEPLVPFPHVPLPFRVSIVTHHEEKASKNTGVQVAILAAGQVDLHSMSNVPTDVDPSRCAVLFPSDSALEVPQLKPDSVDRLFIIDSRWKKAGELVRTETFQRMRAVKLSQTRSAFWRFHTRGVAEEGVCTVEALYFFLEALVKHGKLSDPRFTAPHAFDNLLWYFVYQHQVVQQAAQKRLQQRGGQGSGKGQEQDGEQEQRAPGADDGRQRQQPPQQQPGRQQQQRQPQKQKQEQRRQQQQQQRRQKEHRERQEGQGEGVLGPEVQGGAEAAGEAPAPAGQGHGAEDGRTDGYGESAQGPLGPEDVTAACGPAEGLAQEEMEEGMEAPGDKAPKRARL